jgi:transposase-like protein
MEEAIPSRAQEIQSLKKQLWRAKRDNKILKKATAFVCYGQSVSNMITRAERGLPTIQCTRVM